MFSSVLCTKLHSLISVLPQPKFWLLLGGDCEGLFCWSGGSSREGQGPRRKDHEHGHGHEVGDPKIIILYLKVKNKKRKNTVLYYKNRQDEAYCSVKDSNLSRSSFFSVFFILIVLI
jgi:hypothetical protein